MPVSEYKMDIIGIDVGLKYSYYVVLRDRKVIETGKLDEIKLESFKIDYAGIDAPLTLPESGTLRECERKLLNAGIKLFPSGSDFFKPVALKGMEIAKKLESNSIKVWEVYPYATRKILGISPESKKKNKNGLKKIVEELRKYIEFDVLENSDVVDAAISTLTVKLFLEGKGRFISGKDGKILVPIRIRSLNDNLVG
jgi:hypothetical protein